MTLRCMLIVLVMGFIRVKSGGRARNYQYWARFGPILRLATYLAKLPHFWPTKIYRDSYMCFVYQNNCDPYLYESEYSEESLFD